MKNAHVSLSTQDRKELNQLLAKGELPVRVTKRCMALLALDRGQSYAEVAPLVSLSYGTTKKMGKRYRSEGLSLIYDKPRSGRPPVITTLQKAKITALACTDPDEGHSQWSLRMLADRAVELNYVEHISHNEVGKILKKTSSSHTAK
jgi:transposase